MKKAVLLGVLMAVFAFTGFLPETVSAATQAQSSGAEMVNINQADSLGLQALPGVGPALAERIVTYREAHGPFTSVEQLTEVKGIGERKIEKFKDQLVLK